MFKYNKVVIIKTKVVYISFIKCFLLKISCLEHTLDEPINICGVYKFLLSNLLKKYNLKSNFFLNTQLQCVAVKTKKIFELTKLDIWIKQ